MKTFKLLLGSVLITALIPSSGFARSGSLTAGVSLSLDYEERSYTSTEENADLSAEDDDYRKIIISPMIQYESRSERDRVELKAAPGIKYDLIDDDTDWDSDFYAAAERSLSKAWHVSGSNRFLQSDYHNSDSINTDTTTGGQTNDTDNPELSSDPGRKRYWQNTLELGTDYTYQEESLLKFSFNWIVLRNDETGTDSSYEDYDRYRFSLRNEHRFSKRWKSIVDLAYVRGDYDKTDAKTVNDAVESIAPDSDTAPIEEDLSNDLQEYYLTLTAENNSIERNPLSLTYNYIGTKYDAATRDDGDIHELQFTWRNDISPHLYTILGAGPSYEKTEGQDANWGGNGIAEMNYRVQHGFFNVKVEKKYDVDNFSGTDERGFVDSWDAGISFNYLLTKELTLDGSLSYLYEKREDLRTAIERAVNSGTAETGNLRDLEEYEKENYTAEIGLAYEFFQYYTARASYAYTRQESDRAADDYDDHRLFLTLSWQQELFRW